MRFQSDKNHVIDLLFPITLFFIFAASAIVVLLFAANIYRSTTAASDEHYTARTSLAYVSEKIRQSDGGDSIRLGTFGSINSLILDSTYDDELFHTYIYFDQGSMKELYVKDGVDATPADGKTIVDVNAFTIEERANHVLKFTVTDKDQKTYSVLASTR